MITKTYNKNKFGGYTYEIKIDEIWRIDIHETNSPTYIIEIKEFGFFKDKIHFSFVTNNEFEKTIIESLDKAYDFFLSQKNWKWTLEQRDRKEKEIFSILRNYNYHKVNNTIQKEILTLETDKKESLDLKTANNPLSVELRNQAKELILSQDYIKRYFGEDIDKLRKNHPTERDIKKHEELVGKLDEDAKKYFVEIMTKPSEFYVKKINLNVEEIEQLKALNRKLNDWLTLEGTVSPEGRSLADILKNINNIEKENDKKEAFILEWEELEKKIKDKTGVFTIFINQFFIPDLICPKTFIGNLCFLRGSKNPNHGTNSTKSISEIPKGFDIMFIAGYPDVFNWTQNNLNNGKIKAFKKLNKLPDMEAEKYFNNPKKYYKFYRKLIKQYKSENSKLECYLTNSKE